MRKHFIILGTLLNSMILFSQVGISTTTPTETFDVAGNTRLRNLPQNGISNAIFTQVNGAASATQNQSFMATKTVVADDNGVLGSINLLPITKVFAGGDNMRVIATPVVIGAAGGESTKELLRRTFTVGKKSVITFSYSISVLNLVNHVDTYAGYGISDGVPKHIGTALMLYKDAVGTELYFPNNRAIVRSNMPYTSSQLGGAWGVFYMTATRNVILEPGTYTVVMNGSVFAQDSENGIRATFGGDNWDDSYMTDDRLDIIGVPIE